MKVLRIPLSLKILRYRCMMRAGEENSWVPERKIVQEFSLSNVRGCTAAVMRNCRRDSGFLAKRANVVVYPAIT